MKSRLIITLLCVGAVAFACGPRARSDANGAGASTTALASAVSQQGAPRTPRAERKSQPVSPISATLEVRSEASGIRLALRVVNTGRKSVELTFPSGQTHDFVILDSLGRELWRWAEGRMFTQALQNRLLGGGESVELTESWSNPALKPGRYAAVAVLRSTNFPVTQRMEFAIRSATLAARE